MGTRPGRIIRGAHLLSLALSGPLTGQEPPATFPAQLEQVTVDVVVTDGKGVPIQGLKADDLQILEDGVPQAIVSFEAFVAPPAGAEKEVVANPRVSTNLVGDEGRKGRTFVIVFDDVHLSAFTAQRAKAAIASFVRTGTREGDRVTLTATGSGAYWSARMSAGRDALVEAVKRFAGRYVPDPSRDYVSDYEAMRIRNYHDTMILNRVQRRFEAAGVQTLLTQQGQHVQNMMAVEDPYVTARATEVYYTATTRNRVTLEALQRSLDALVDQKGRKSLVLLSEGFIYDHQLPEFKRLIDASRRANTAMYFVNSRGLEGLPLTMTAEFGGPLPAEDIGSAFTASMEDTEGSESLAADSGGFTVRNTNDLGAGLERIGEETRAYYLVGYNPKNTARDGVFRKIEVKVVGRKGTRVRARKGYYAPGDPNAPPVKPGIEARFQKALDAPYPVSDVPLRMTHFVREETLVGKARVLVATEVDIRGLGLTQKDGHQVGSVQFLLVATHRESGEHFRYDQTVALDLDPGNYESLAEKGLPIVRDFELPPGSYQAKIVVRDGGTDRMGTVVHDFEVPDPGAFRVSTPVLSDVREAAGPGEAGDRLALQARRDYSPEASLFCQLEVYGATREEESRLPRVSMGYEVRRLQDGALYTREAPSRISPGAQGGLSRLIGFPLRAATPGDYDLVMKVKDEFSGKTLELHEPFSVSAVPPVAPVGP
ncbi:MAG TPA: VWA domain-containing protein [Vicinamibacteria bacterium]|nr:VWA domain-containing protein [Vicinamibacteria bacterium]